MKKYITSPSGSSNYIIVGDGYVAPDGFTLSDAPNLLPPDATAIEEARKEALYDACIKWQSRPADPHTCDSNFFAMLTSIKTLSRITGLPVAIKAAACLAWLDTLWGDYYVRKANGSTDYDFSAHGGCPHSFLEVREEAGE